MRKTVCPLRFLRQYTGTESYYDTQITENLAQFTVHYFISSVHKGGGEVFSKRYIKY